MRTYSPLAAVILLLPLVSADRAIALARRNSDQLTLEDGTINWGRLTVSSIRLPPSPC